MELLYAYYPNFNRNKLNNFNAIWIERLLNGDYEKSLQKVKSHAAESSYPPSLADVFVPTHKPKDDQMAESIKVAEETVRREMADPETAARRRKKLDEMNEKLKRANAYDG